MQTTMRDIWASSPTDVYVVGHNDQPGPGTMFHYDGKKWSTTHFHSADGGTISGPVDFSAVYGFGSNDVYAVGERIYTNPNAPPNFLDSSLIIHYDGQAWREVQISRSRGLATVWGAISGDIWAGGYYGGLYHISYGQCQKMFLDTTISFGSMFGFSSSDIYATCGRILDKDSQRDSSQYLLMHYNGTNWVKIDSFYEFPGFYNEHFGFNLWATSTNLFSVSQSVYKMAGNSWKVLLNTGYPFYAIYGSGENSIFATGFSNQIYHYNGTDWYYFQQFTNPNLYGTSVWCNSKEVFILSSDGSKSYIYHGK
jgi:hypothetical protein